MLKSWAILALGAFLLGWPCVAENQQGDPHAPHNQPSKAQQPTPPVHVIIDNPPLSKAEPDSQKQASTEKPLPQFERPEWVIVYITAVYVLISLLMFFAIRRQANTMEEQATDARASAADAAVVAQGTLSAIEMSAKAAKTSADIAVRVSIPTLVVSEFAFGDTGVASIRAMLQYPKARLALTNYGQSPAFLKFWSVLFVCGNLPAVPIYVGQPGCGITLEKTVVEPMGQCILPDIDFTRRYMMSDEEIEAIISQHTFFTVYGYVCYGDLFGNPWRRFKFSETALNLFEDADPSEAIQWVSYIAPPAYRGTDDFPLGQPIS